eukprot:7489986-Pyramimonas_sp.AAC.1
MRRQRSRSRLTDEGEERWRMNEVVRTRGSTAAPNRHARACTQPARPNGRVQTCPDRSPMGSVTDSLTRFLLLLLLLVHPRPLLELQSTLAHGSASAAAPSQVDEYPPHQIFVVPECPRDRKMDGVLGPWIFRICEYPGVLDETSGALPPSFSLLARPRKEGEEEEEYGKEE